MRVNVCFLTLTLIAPAAPLFGANPLGDESFRIQGRLPRRAMPSNTAKARDTVCWLWVGSSRERPQRRLLKTRLLLLGAFPAIVVGAVLGCTLAFGLGVRETENMKKQN
jgi:hypothetical protein